MHRLVWQRSLTGKDCLRNIAFAKLHTRCRTPLNRKVKKKKNKEQGFAPCSLFNNAPLQGRCSCVHLRRRGIFVALHQQPPFMAFTLMTPVRLLPLGRARPQQQRFAGLTQNRCVHRAISVHAILVLNISAWCLTASTRKTAGCLGFVSFPLTLTSLDAPEQGIKKGERTLQTHHLLQGSHEKNKKEQEFLPALRGRSLSIPPFCTLPSDA